MIHIRLTDYVNLQDYHPIPPLEYYKKALSYYKLDKYQIILFSDDINKAKEKLKELNINFISANELYTNDEDQFYMMCLSQIRICANSSFSLMNCYLNEMYNFRENCEYIFPHKFFGSKGPEYNIEDHILNYKFYIIDYDNLNTEKKYDVVTTLHVKDKCRYIEFLKYNKKYLVNVDEFHYVSYEKYNCEAKHISESEYPFSKKEVIEYIKDYVPNYRWGWYYQQLLKLYIFKAKKFKYDNVLIFDSDILLLKNIYLFDGNNPKIFKRNTGDKKIHTPYIKCMNYILPNLNIDENDSGICHMMLFNKKYLDDMFNEIETLHKKELWKVCLDGVINCVKNGVKCLSILSEYELYYNYIKNKNLYIYDNGLNYSDCCIKNFDFQDKTIYFVADHHYQSRGCDDWKTDNLIEEELNDYKILNDIITYYKSNGIKSTDFEKHTNKELLEVFIGNLFNHITYEKIMTKLKCNYFSDDDIVNIIRNENYLKVKNIRKNIDIIVESFLKNNILIDNHFIESITLNNINLSDNKYYFGIVIPTYNRYYITKIFLECLKKNVNYKSVIFCFVDDGSNDKRLLDEYKNLNVKSIVVIFKRNKNIFGSNNTKVPGSMYPMTLYTGHELIKNNCEILGVLDSDSFIKPNYFKLSEEITKSLNMTNTIFSGFNSYSECHKIFGHEIINGKNILYKNMVGGISQFYSINLYEKIKLKFTGEESCNYWAYDYDFQISNYMMANNFKYFCLEESIVQHIGINTTMVRMNNELCNNDKIIVKDIYELLINPNYKKNIKVNFDFDIKCKFELNNINDIFRNIWINIFVDKIYYINLDSRTDRKINIETQFKKHGITNYVRFSGICLKFNKKYTIEEIDGQIENFLNGDMIVDDLIEEYHSKYILGFDKEYIKSKNKENRRKYILGALGCKMSHISILNSAKHYNNIIIFEDDALLHDNFIYHLNLLIKNSLNLNYDILWLSPNWLYKNNNRILNRCHSYEYINENFARINSSISIDGKYGSTNNNAGLIFSNKCINFITNNFDSFIQYEMDLIYRQYIQINNNCYTPIPNLIFQQVEKSNIEEFKVNYDKDIHYKTRQKFNIVTIVKEHEKEKYIDNLKNNLQKMIGYENIYYISNKKLFNNELLIYIENNLQDNEDEIIKKFIKLTHSNIKYFFNMKVNVYLENIYLPFDENNNLIKNDNFIICDI